MAIIVSHSHVVHVAFVSSLVCQTFDPMILDRLSFPGTRCFQGGTRWKYKAYKWYAIRKSLGTAGLSNTTARAKFAPLPLLAVRFWRWFPCSKQSRQKGRTHLFPRMFKYASA